MSDERNDVDARVRDARDGAAALLNAHVVSIEKRHVIGERTREVIAKLTTATKDPLPASNVLPSDDEAALFYDRAQAIVPPYEPATLVTLHEQSNALGSNVDAYKTNIESYGYRFEPVLDLEDRDIDKKIGDAMFLEALHKASADDVPQASYPKPEEIAARKKEIDHLMRLERAKLETLFEEAVPGSSFVELKEWTRTDLEVTGNAYWEVIRNGRGEVAQFGHAPSHSVRLLPLDYAPIEVRERTRVSALSYEYTTKRRRFRRFVQVVASFVVYFKEYGDPRTMSARTGRFFPSVEALEREEGANAVPATEIIHFRIFSPRSPYGVPRWIGNLISVMGSRASEEVNYLYFDNKGVPPMAVLVSGGKLTDAATAKIENYVQNHLKGRKNFHKILIIEAEGSSTPGQPSASRIRIELKPLGSEQQADAHFQTYDERNIDKIGSSFRMPRLLRGDVRDFNRGTAEAALQFAEIQVFQPERSRNDIFIDRQILAPLGVRFWRFVSKAPISRDPAVLTDILTKLVERGILTPGEARADAGAVLNRDLKHIDADWMKQPLALTLAGILPPDGPEADALRDMVSPSSPASDGTPAAAKPLTPEQRALAAVAANLTALRDRLRVEEKAANEKIDKEERRAFDEGQVVIIPVPRAELEAMVEPT